jgi:peptidoglycan/xylan/chitin deacetylase (PgdA/CDA1 family)
MMHSKRLPSWVVGVAVIVAAILPFSHGSPAHAETTPACPSGSVALTYDDGPVTGRTEVILVALDWVGVNATFFMIGSRVERFPDTATEVARRGHTVANHTWAHVDLIGLSDAEVRTSVHLADDALTAIGIETLPLVRPPFLRANSRVRGIIEEAGFLAVLPTVNPKDWDDIDVEVIIDRVVNGASDGAVIGLHDGHKPYQRSGVATIGIVERLAEEGFCFGVLDASGAIINATPAMVADARRVWMHGRLSRWSLLRPR